MAVGGVCAASPHPTPDSPHTKTPCYMVDDYASAQMFWGRADDAEERAVVRLVDIVYDATDEAAVIAWMAANKVQASTLTAKHASDESTALLLALRRKWPAAAKGIADVQRDFGDANSLGDTALHWACLRAGEDAGVLALAEQLLAAGADPNATGDLGNTPLHLAAATNCPLVRCLVWPQSCYAESACCISTHAGVQRILPRTLA